jgi:hypothetical protein
MNGTKSLVVEFYNIGSEENRNGSAILWRNVFNNEKKSDFLEYVNNGLDISKSCYYYFIDYYAPMTK